MDLKQHKKLSKICKRLQKLIEPKAQQAMSQLKSILDNDYHSVITDEQFKELGHIYYGD